MKPSSLKYLDFNCHAERQAKEYEYKDYKMYTHYDEGSPNSFGNNNYCEVTKTTKSKNTSVAYYIPYF